MCKSYNLHSNVAQVKIIGSRMMLMCRLSLDSHPGASQPGLGHWSTSPSGLLIALALNCEAKVGGCRVHLFHLEYLLPITPGLSHPSVHSDPPPEGHRSQIGILLQTRLHRFSKTRDKDRDLGKRNVTHSLLKHSSTPSTPWRSQ